MARAQGLQQFINKPSLNHVEPLDSLLPCLEDKEDAPTVGKSSRPRALFLLYAAIQRRHGQWVASYRGDKRMRTCFRKLAKKLEGWKELGLTIEDTDYILAHKATFGKGLRPNHLISWCSLSIYESYMTSLTAKTVKLSPIEQDDYDQEMVNYLSNLRGESKEAIRNLLEVCDLL